MKIGKHTVVKLHYELHAGFPGEEKIHIETTDKTNPFVFLSGAGNLIQGFENNLQGLQKGDLFEFMLNPDEGYGPVDQAAVIQLPISIFKVDGVIDLSVLKIGNILPMSDNEGNVMNGKVVSHNDEDVTMDFNHPLAGYELQFKGEVLEVRGASTEEVDHGHVH